MAHHEAPDPEQIPFLEFGLEFEFAVSTDENGAPLPDTEWSTQRISAGVGQAAFDLAVLNLYANRRAMVWQPHVRSCNLIWSEPVHWATWPNDSLPPDPNAANYDENGQPITGDTNA
ncbi:hypothetical protein HWB99_gp012 [Mycobacterium phage DrLupo]|uniref:Uncharacterized protein n=1 Tax=Mycobacterium phage DrLupo TaxID=2499037 RepID=A0A3S9UQH5_9CAUD|nr:hypothetical protein HWB99_gp012 [Mycobacterium phage DrLupo]AZS12548.1 hypothetical protein SEA_DRLUPO_12 [Mycobacterium phage DrLupo]